MRSVSAADCSIAITPPPPPLMSGDLDGELQAWGGGGGRVAEEWISNKTEIEGRLERKREREHKGRQGKDPVRAV